MGRFIGLRKRDEMGETFEISVTLLLGYGRAYSEKSECEVQVKREVYGGRVDG